jgi:hypothetical protein
MYRRSLEIEQSALSPGHRHRVMVVEGLAAFLRETGRAAEAEALEASEKELRSAEASEPS